MKRRSIQGDNGAGSGLGTNSQAGTITRLHANMSMFDTNAVAKARGSDLVRVNQALGWHSYVLGDDKPADITLVRV